MAILNTLKDKTKEQDLFGYPVSLYFNRRGRYYNTVGGGCISVFIKLFVLAYLLLLIFKMLTYSDDNINTFKESIRFDDEGHDQILGDDGAI